MKGWAGAAGSQQDQGRELPAGSGLSLGGGVAGAGKKRGMEAISETSTEGGSACGC